MNKSENLRNATNNQSNPNTKTQSKSISQWRVWLGVLAVITVTIADWQWFWGIIFLFWILPDIRNRITYFIEPVERDVNPILYWVIVSTWIVLSILSFSTLFFDFNTLGY